MGHIWRLFLKTRTAQSRFAVVGERIGFFGDQQPDEVLQGRSAVSNQGVGPGSKQSFQESRFGSLEAFLSTL